MVSVPLRTSPTTRARLAFMPWSACISRPVSSRVFTTTSLRRSPAATVCATCTASLSGRVMLRVSSQASTAPSASASTASTITLTRPER